MGCCGVSVEERKTPNQRYEQKKPNSLNATDNKNNQNNQSESINVFPATKKPNNENKRNKSPLTNDINNNTQQITFPSVSQKKEIDDYKKDKVKSFKNIQILDNVKEYLPEDVSREEIEEMVLNAIGSNGIDPSRYVKGKNLTKEHVEAIIDILYMTLIGRNNGDKNYEKLLEDVKLKIGFCDVNKESVKNIMFKGQNPTDEEIDQVLEQFKSTINPKLFVIELLD